MRENEKHDAVLGLFSLAGKQGLFTDTDEHALRGCRRERIFWPDYLVTPSAQQSR